MSEKLAAIVREDEEKARAAGRAPASRRRPPRRAATRRPKPRTVVSDAAATARGHRAGRRVPDRRGCARARVRRAARRAADPAHQPPPPRRRRHRLDGRARVAAARARQGPRSSTRSIRSRAATSGCRSSDTTVHTIPFDERFDCTIVVDCADITLLGDTLPPPEVCGTLITLDHHASGHPFGDIAVWDPTAAAVGVLVHRIAQREGWPITAEAAVPLYVSLISDTGGFRHANTNAEALRVGSELIRAGVVPSTIAARARGAAEPRQAAAARLGAVDARAALRRPRRRAQRHDRHGRGRARVVGRHRGHGQLGAQRRGRAGRRAAHHREGRRRARLDALAQREDRRRQGLHDARRRRPSRRRRLSHQRRSRRRPRTRSCARSSARSIAEPRP